MDARIRARAKDAADELDNVTAYCDEASRQNIIAYVVEFARSFSELGHDDREEYIARFIEYTGGLTNEEA